MTSVLETMDWASGTADAGRSMTAPWPYPKARSSGSSGRTSGQDHLVASRRRAAVTNLGQHLGPRRTPLRQPGPSGPCRLCRPGHADLRGAFSGKAPAHGRHSQPDLGRQSRREPDRTVRRRPATAVRSLSGGQRAQLALTLAIAKRSELLVLDEPVASLHPLARREFLQSPMEVVAVNGVSVVLSSHLVADLERVCDYLVVLVAGEVGHRAIRGAIRSRRRLSQAFGNLGIELPRGSRLERPQMSEQLAGALAGNVGAG